MRLMEEYADYVDINLGDMAVSCQLADPLRNEDLGSIVSIC